MVVSLFVNASHNFKQNNFVPFAAKTWLYAYFPIEISLAIHTPAMQNTPDDLGGLGRVDRKCPLCVKKKGTSCEVQTWREGR